jgi:hypothetical protein
MPRPEHWNDDTKAAWLKAHEQPDPFDDHPGPATHILTYRPEVRISVVLPPWIDADDWRREASKDWDGWLETVLNCPSSTVQDTPL